MWKDDITIGSTKVIKTAVEVAEHAGGTYDAPSSGLVGLGFDKINEGEFFYRFRNRAMLILSTSHA